MDRPHASELGGGITAADGTLTSRPTELSRPRNYRARIHAQLDALIGEYERPRRLVDVSERERMYERMDLGAGARAT